MPHDATTIDDHARMSGHAAKTLLDAMDELPCTPDIDFEPPRLDGPPCVPDLE